MHEVEGLEVLHTRCDLCGHVDKASVTVGEERTGRKSSIPHDGESAPGHAGSETHELLILKHLPEGNRQVIPLYAWKKMQRLCGIKDSRKAGSSDCGGH